ncbi:GNAT family N-acetyltransferase [Microbacteriaceae bacterium VKM Ac-2855]|nr:GNAT family N-acetyltransferase [Microbacteriaceae bacterium VKM Ac-2855]
MIDPGVSDATLDVLAAAAWPGLTVEPYEGWRLRAAGGVTKRANSVLPLGDVTDAERAIDAAEAFAAAQRIPPLFQLSPASRPADLAERLAARGYEAIDPTIVLTGSIDTALARLAPGEPARLDDEPDAAWLDVWWSVDGRGGAAELDVARRILAAIPSRYASVGSNGATHAVGRLTTIDAPDGTAWAGLHAIATRPEARRLGHARTIIRSLLQDARGRGVERLWIQVLAENTGARRLYSALGCEPASRYAYWRR